MVRSAARERGCFIAAFAGLLLVGCANPDGAITSQSRLLSTASANSQPLSAADWPHPAWWRRYHDSQLDTLMAEALQDSPSLRGVEARVREALAASGMAEASGMPQVNARVQDTDERYSSNSTFPKPLAGSRRWFNEATLNIGYEIDFWGKNRALLAGALDRVHGSALDEQAARLMLESAVVQTYFKLAQNYRQLDLNGRMLREHEDLLALTRQRLAAGIDSDVEQKQAESAIPVAEQQLSAQQETIALERNQLAALLGKGPERGWAIQPPALHLDQAVGLPARIPAECIGHRPDVVAQRWRVEAAAQDVAAARAQFYPNVSLLAFAGFQSLGLDRFLEPGSSINGSGPALSLPVFDGGRLRGNLGARHAEYDMAVEQYNQTIIDALQDVASQIDSIRATGTRREQQRAAVVTARAALDLSIQRYRAGVGSYLQVLNLQLQLDAQNRQLIDLDAGALQLDASLIRALGGNDNPA